MPHWTRALKPYQDEETGETILFYPCPKIPNDIIRDIIKEADGGRTAHSKKLKTCLEEMLEKYTVDFQVWGSMDEDDADRQFDLRLWITDVRGVRSNVDACYRDPDTGEWSEPYEPVIENPSGEEYLYDPISQDQERAENWGEDIGKGHAATFNYPHHPDGIWGICEFVCSG